MKRILIFVVSIGAAASLSALPLFEQPNRHFGFFGHRSGHVGFFGGERFFQRPGRFGSFFGTGHFGPRQGFFSQGHQDLADPGPGHFLDQAGPWYGWSSGFSYPRQGPSGGFVQSWKDRDPAMAPALEAFASPSNSLLLQEGMSEEAVVQAVGMPLDRMWVEGSQIWKYSSFSLLFEAGRLKGIQ